MSTYQKVLFPILRALSEKDAEKAHLLALRAIQTLQHIPFVLRLIAYWCAVNKDPRPCLVSGIKFPHRVGLAAGLDKQAQMLPFLQAIGFGFIEVGTVLPREQPGNPRPRLARTRDHALWNCMGFNSDGASAVALRLADVRRGIHIPVGISLGKQKETPLDDAAEDYVRVLQALGPYASYYAINVSSPNTPGLRRLQGREYLEALVRRVVRAEMIRSSGHGRWEKPVFVKFAPDLTDDEMALSIGVSEQAGARGIIIGNTTTRPPRGFSPPGFMLDENGKPKGGFSGPHQFNRTLAMVMFARKRTRLPIIACGGITSGVDAARLYGAGANLLQILTGFVYQGPALIRQLRGAG